jgi:phosphoadenosine phosphosulfate reductase
MSSTALRAPDLDLPPGPLEGWPPEEILAWAAERFAPRIALATGFGAEGCVLVDMIARHGLTIDVFTLDTGLLFAESYELWQRLERRYGLRIQAVRPELSVSQQAAEWGGSLWEREPDRCCGIRKVEPLRGFLQGLDAWVTAIRRDGTAARAEAQVVEPDRRFGLVKVNPLVGWTHDQVWAYLRRYDVPYNPLHARGYPSIGCWPCTSAVRPGEDPRAGRWRGKAKTECGLHARPQSQAVISTLERPKE